MRHLAIALGLVAALALLHEVQAKGDTQPPDPCPIDMLEGKWHINLLFSRDPDGLIVGVEAHLNVDEFGQAGLDPTCGSMSECTWARRLQNPRPRFPEEITLVPEIDSTLVEGAAGSCIWTLDVLFDGVEDNPDTPEDEFRPLVSYVLGGPLDRHGEEIVSCTARLVEPESLARPVGCQAGKHVRPR